METTIQETYVWTNLANAIVKQACVDYYNDLRYLRNHSHGSKAELKRTDMENIERWVHTQDYELFTSVDGDWLLEEVRKKEKADWQELCQRKIKGLQKTEAC